MSWSRGSSRGLRRLFGEIACGFEEEWADGVRDRPDMSKNLLRHLVDILVAVIEESGSIPSGVMDCIVSQFTDYASVSEVD